MGLRTLPLRRPLFRHPSALQTHERQTQEPEKKSLGSCRTLDIRGLVAQSTQRNIPTPHCGSVQTQTACPRLTLTVKPEPRRCCQCARAFSACARLLSELCTQPSQNQHPGLCASTNRDACFDFLTGTLRDTRFLVGSFFSDVTKWFQPMISGNVDHVHREPSAGVSGFGLVPQRRFRG